MPASNARAFALFLFASSSLFGQTVTGTITGTVIDATGAAAPNVSITATQLATNLKTRTQTTDAGVYTLNFLPVGEYNITAEATGFKTATLGPFRLDVNQTVRQDIRLEVGQISEKVEVIATAAILQTENAQTGDVISGQQATELFQRRGSVGGLALGTHAIELRAAGYKPYAGEVTIDGQNRLNVLLDLATR